MADFRERVERQTDPESVPLADTIAEGIPVYAGDRLRAGLEDRGVTRAYMAEWNRVFATGPGIVVFRKAYDDLATLDAVTELLLGILADEAESLAGSGDHFAAAGANSRLWNAHEKLCMASPGLFARYNANPIIPLVSRSWLGPRYQITTQVNLVRPGSAAQVCHRDYHMGFQAVEDLADYPASVHLLSPALTLQGAVAHSDMPLDSGPTKLLPYSQTYGAGYIAGQLPEFRAYFEAHHVQLPLDKGDAVFFNPAVFHAAGENRTADHDRFANLMQIGSGYGRSIETVDRARMCAALYPYLRRVQAQNPFGDRALGDIIAACAEGYPFPTNLDRDSPLDGMAPPSQQDLMRVALAERWPEERFQRELRAQAGRQQSA